MSPLPGVGASTTPPPNPLGAVLLGLDPRTVNTYRRALRYFAAFLGEGSDEAAFHALLAMGTTQADERLAAFRTRLEARRPPLAPASVRGVISAVRSVVRRAHDGPPRRHRTAGLPARAARDRAIERLIHAEGLTCRQVAALDFPADVDPQRKALRTRGETAEGPRWRTIGALTWAALATWIAVRDDRPGPLFGLTEGGMRRAVRRPARAGRGRRAAPRARDPETAAGHQGPPVLDLSRGPNRPPQVRGVPLMYPISRKRFRIYQAMLDAGCARGTRLSGPALDELADCVPGGAIRELRRAREIPWMAPLAAITIFPGSKTSGGYGLAHS